MNAATRVNLHCHSTCSDGTLSPEEMAKTLADAGVVCAALTDHETIAGVARFTATLHRYGVGAVTGVEIPALWCGEEIHLLIYGFDSAHPELLGLLQALRQRHAVTTQSVADSLRRVGATAPAGVSPAAVEVPPQAAEAIALAHRAGGSVFLAHPALWRPELSDLKPLLQALRACGLDGVEALYAPSSAETQRTLTAWAHEMGLLVSAGTDFHTTDDGRRNGLAVEMPDTLWQPLRDHLHVQAATSGARAAAAYAHARQARRPFGLHVVLPAFLAVFLFVVAMWVLLIPIFRHTLLDRKREMIGELTHAVWSLLDAGERQVAAGRLSRAEAQAEALESLAALRYGHENKDYFWVQDMHPRMLMHPYRPDLNGRDLSDFCDPDGTRIFVEFADVVRRRREGLVDYVWQWPDDPRRWEPKESYIKGFEPWGWVIGTGIYLEDVNGEIARLERGLVEASFAITGAILVLLAYLVNHSRRIDHARVEAVEELQTATERYRSLVEAATEGTLLVVDGRCRYANPHLLALLGYTAAELELLGLAEVLPPGPPNESLWRQIDVFAGAIDPAPHGTPGTLRCRNSRRVACSFALSHISFGGRSGMALLVREVGTVTQPLHHAPPDGTAAVEENDFDQAPIGLFQARANRQATLLKTNVLARRFLQAAAGLTDDQHPPTLAAAFRATDSFEVFRDRLLSEGTADCRILTPEGAGAARTLAVRGRLLRDASDQPMTIQGVIEDISSEVWYEQERNAMTERLQTAFLLTLSDRDLAPIQQYSALVMTSEISRASRAEEVMQICRRTTVAVRALMESGAHPRNAVRLISSVCDAATERFVALAIEELGPPPARFAFLALGSQGRQDQTLLTDQDNAIIYATPEPDGAESDPVPYFVALGKQVCGWLNEAGYPFCRGRFMAQNPVWTRALQAWKTHFSYWAAHAEPEELLIFTVFFDFRAVCGEPALVDELRQHVFAAVHDAPLFFTHIARDALQFKPPVMLLGRILIGNVRSASRGTVDLKTAMLPIVAFARLYALRHACAQTNTIERLQALCEAGKLSPASRDEIVATYTFLMRLRLQQQLRDVHQGKKPGNLVRVRQLGYGDRTLLQHAFAHIRALQRRIEYEFLGGTHA